MSTDTPNRTTIGPYRITGFLGAGGMGMVWRGTHVELHRDVAIKRLSESASAGIPLERFRNEARLHGTLNHPRIAQLYDFIEDDGAPCIVLEYVAGPTLEQQLRSGPMELPIAIETLAMVADAVGYLHQRGIMHRDIKPSNVKLRPDGSPVLLDFGIARADGDPRLTKTGMIIGSPHTIAPEQFENKPLDARSDIWALGVLFYEMITGVPPFTGESVAVLASAILATTPVPPSMRVKALSPRVDAVIAKCLQRDPAKRYQSTSEFVLALRALPISKPLPRPMSGSEPRASRRTIQTALLAAVALAVVLGALAFRRATAERQHSVADSVATRVVAPANAASTTPVAADPATATLTTRISVADGNAAVVIDGREIGVTPYVHSAPAGTSVTLTLRRAGFRDETITFIVSDNQRDYTLVMQRDTSAPVTPALLGLLGWFRRRKRAPSPLRTGATTPGVTGERNALISLQFHAAARTDVGCVRDGNEDAVRVVHVPDGSLVAILCDGMGGHAAGEVASDLAIRAIAEQAALLDSAHAMNGAVTAANKSIRVAMARDAKLHGMGTTCVVLRLFQQWALCAHVGDSRAYLFRDGTIYRLTEDHSHVRGLVRDGSLPDAAARHHPDKNVILRALGPSERVDATNLAAPLQVRDGDRFLLSSDGLHDLADDAEFVPALLLADPDAACASLIALARDRGAPDNVSVCVVDATLAPSAAIAETRAIEIPQ
jgi:eukaryotic-like serine/threonine-protein kinase